MKHKGKRIPLSKKMGRELYKRNIRTPYLPDEIIFIKNNKYEGYVDVVRMAFVSHDNTINEERLCFYLNGMLFDYKTKKIIMKNCNVRGKSCRAFVMVRKPKQYMQFEYETRHVLTLCELLPQERTIYKHKKLNLRKKKFTKIFNRIERSNIKMELRSIRKKTDLWDNYVCYTPPTVEWFIF